jgi:hypothetical protein
MFQVKVFSKHCSNLLKALLPRFRLRAAANTHSRSFCRLIPPIFSLSVAAHSPVLRRSSEIVLRKAA